MNPSARSSNSIVSDDDEAPEQISFAQSRDEALQNEKDERPVQMKTKKRKQRTRRGDRKRTTSDVHEGDGVDGSSDLLTAAKRKKENGVEICLPQRTIEVRSGTKIMPSMPVCHSDFKEEMLSRRKRVRPISTSRLAAYRSSKQPYR